MSSRLLRGNAALEERLKKQEEMQELFDSIGDTIENGILDSINAGIDAMVDGTKDLDEALQEIASGVLKDIGQMLIKFGLQQAFAALPGGGIGGALGGLFRAEGGPVTGGQPYIVGEKGPELMVPRTSGTVLAIGTLKQHCLVTALLTPAALKSWQCLAVALLNRMGRRISNCHHLQA